MKTVPSPEQRRAATHGAAADIGFTRMLRPLQKVPPDLIKATGAPAGGCLMLREQILGEARVAAARVGKRRRTNLSACRLAVIIVYAALAGVLGGYFGGKVASAESLRVALQYPYIAPAPRQWADI